MRTIIAITSITLLSTAAVADTPPADRCAADLAAAKASLVQARHALAQSNREMDVDRYRVASQLADAALEQYRTSRALCTSTTEKQTSPFASEPDPFDPAKVPAPVWHEPIPVPGIPYLVDPAVEANCPGPECPVVSLAKPDEDDSYKPERW